MRVIVRPAFDGYANDTAAEVRLLGRCCQFFSGSRAIPGTIAPTNQVLRLSPTAITRLCWSRATRDRRGSNFGRGHRCPGAPVANVPWEKLEPRIMARDV